MPEMSEIETYLTSLIGVDDKNEYKSALTYNKQ